MVRRLLGRAAAISAVLLIASSVGCGKKRVQGKGAMRIAGASNLVFVMEELIPLFETQSGATVDFIQGSSGKLAAQIREGAPFDVFMAANVAFVDDVIAAHSCEPDSKRVYGQGRIALWMTESSQGPPDDLARLADPAFATIAIAKPEHAPYGAAAVQALEKAGVWDAIKSRVIYGSNISDTLTMAATGNADVAIASLSLALQEKGKYREIPASMHESIDQAMAVCKGGQRIDQAIQFAEFMKSDEARQLLSRYGYTVP